MFATKTEKMKTIFRVSQLQYTHITNNTLTEFCNNNNNKNNNNDDDDNYMMLLLCTQAILILCMNRLIS